MTALASVMDFCGNLSAIVIGGLIARLTAQRR